MFEELTFFRYRIKISIKSVEYNSLKKFNIGLVEINEDKSNGFYSSKERYNKGILDFDDKQFIIKNKLKVNTISGYLNGNYSALADMNIYDIFDKNEVKNNLKNIFYNAILSKVNDINAYGSLYYFVGHLPKLTSKFDNNTTDFKQLYKSFNSFLKISLLNE